MQNVVYRKGKPIFAFDPTVEGRLEEFIRWLKQLDEISPKKEVEVLRAITNAEQGQRTYIFENQDVFVIRVTNIIPITPRARKTSTS